MFLTAPQPPLSIPPCTPSLGSLSDLPTRRWHPQPSSRRSTKGIWIWWQGWGKQGPHCCGRRGCARCWTLLDGALSPRHCISCAKTKTTAPSLSLFACFHVWCSVTIPREFLLRKRQYRRAHFSTKAHPLCMRLAPTCTCRCTCASTCTSHITAPPHVITPS